MNQARAFLILRGDDVIGFVSPGDRVQLPPDEAAVWERVEGDVARFESALGPEYTLVEMDDESRDQLLALGGELVDRRRYFLFHNAEVVGVLEALFENGEYSRLLNEEEALAKMPEPLSELWERKKGDLGQFLLGLEEEERRYNYLESLPDETVAELAHEMEVDRAEITLHWERGLAMRDRFLFLRALRELEIAAALCDKYAMVDFLAELCNEMGNIYIAFEDFEAAIEVLEEGLSYDPHDTTCRVRVLTNLSQAYDMAGKRKKAIERVEEALEIVPPDIYDSLLAGLYAQAASLYNQEGDYDKAIQLYKLASYLADNSKTVSDQEKAMFHNNLGMAYLDHGEMELAFEHMQKAVALQPQDPFYQENLDRCSERRQ